MFEQKVMIPLFALATFIFIVLSLSSMVESINIATEKAGNSFAQTLTDPLNVQR